MGIDTVKLKSPPIDETLATFLENQSILKTGVDCYSGAILYEITTGQLEGSFDSRVSFAVKREDWIIGKSGRPELKHCEPYILIEASLHKFFMGHNVFAGPTNFQKSCDDFLNHLMMFFLDRADPNLEKFEILDFFPSTKSWEVRRVDWAEVYRLPQAAIREFFRSIKNCKFPRRGAKEAKYDMAVHFPGKFTTTRIYHKGSELKVHGDLKKIEMFYARYLRQETNRQTDINDDIDYVYLNNLKVQKKIKALQRLADQRLRAEVQINGDKLHHDFGGRYPLVSEITDEYLIEVHKHDIYKLLREGKTEMETVRTCDKVQARLNDVYTRASANSLMSFWMQMSGRGEEITREQYSKSQFYSNRKKLVDAGISWHQSNIYILDQETALPPDFSPVPENSRRCITPVSKNSIFNKPISYFRRQAA